MRQEDFRNLILVQIRKMMPEIPSWQDMVRILRMRTGHNISSPDQLDYSNELIAAELAGFYKYAQILKAAKDNFVMNAARDSTGVYAEVSTANTPIVFVEDLSIAAEPNAPQPTIFPTKTPTKPPLWRAKMWQGDILWYESGSIVGICPARSDNYTFFIYAVIRPYYDKDNMLVGVEPGDEHSIARYIAGELIESINPELGMTWKNDSVTQWALKRQHLAWQESISNPGRPRPFGFRR
jgi:hypothetical protein